MNRLLPITLLMLLVPGPLSAGVYSSLESPPFDIGADGIPIALPPSGFHNQLATVMDMLVEVPGKPPKPDSPRGKYLALIESLKRKSTAELNGDELRDLSAAWIRTGKTDAAIDLLRPLSRDRRANFFTWTHLAHVSALLDQWPEAREAQQIARSESMAGIPNATPAQIEWYRKVERDYYLKWLMLRSAEQRGSGFSRVADDVDAIFGDVRFIGENGEYQPNTIAAAEKAKLPPDALAIAQQLSLWSPTDTRLYWLVGELYNANGDAAAAARIFDACVGDSRRYQNPTLSEHRRILREHLAAEQAAREQIEAEAWKPDATRVWLVLLLAVPTALFFIVWQLRVWLKPRKR